MPSAPNARSHNDPIDSGAGAGLDRDDSSDGSRDHNERHFDEQDSQGSGGSGTPISPKKVEEEEPMVTRPPRKPWCRCSCFSCNLRTVSAAHEEIQEVLKVMTRLTLREDVIVGGELLGAKSHLLRVGNHWRRRGVWEISDDIDKTATSVLKSCIDEELRVRLTFKCPEPPLPWRIPLKCPCCVFLLTVLVVGLLLVMGISSSVSIDTNFDSFMDSDSQSSLYYNAFLDAVKNPKYKVTSARRLQEEHALSTSRSWSLWDRWQAFEDMASRPMLDDAGHWHPARALAKVVFGNSHSDVGTWISDDIVDNTSRRLQGTDLYKLFTIQVTYATKKEGESILKNKHLAKIHEIETQLKALTEWKILCDKADPKGNTGKYCYPGLSFPNIVYAMRVKKASPSTATTLFFNGTGYEALPLDLAVSFAKAQGVLPLMFPIEQAEKQRFQVEGLPCIDLDKKCELYKSQGYCKPFAQYETYMQDFCAKTCNFCGLTDAYGNSSAPPAEEEVVSSIRSNFRFQTFCCKSTDTNKGEKERAVVANWNSFIAALVDLLNDEQDEDLRVFFAGDGIEGYEAMAALFSDMKFAAASYCFVLTYATMHTRSIFLSFAGLFLVMLSIPSALAIFTLASGTGTISLMSCLSIFIVIGLGSDMLFVYTDFWKQSIAHSRDRAERLKFTYTQAASSTAATTFTTAMSFLANLASVLRPLREFGFFMGACVVMAWLIMFFGYPPILVIGERCHRRMRHALAPPAREAPLERRPSIGRRSITSLHKRGSSAMAQFLDPEKKGVGEVHKGLLGSREKPGFADLLREWKLCVLIVFVILTVGSLALAMDRLTQAQGVPQIFPKDHNQVMGKVYNGKFKSFDKQIAQGAAESATECNDLFADGCTQFRCETTGRSMGEATECQCYPQGERVGACGPRPYKLQVHFRVLGRQGLPANAVVSANYSGVLATRFPSMKSISAMKVLPSQSAQASECLVENWESGRQRLATMVNPGYMEAVLRERDATDSSYEPCVEQQICYCGIERCRGSGSGMGYGSLKLGAMGFGYDWNSAGGRLLSPEVAGIRNPMSGPLSGRRLKPKVRPENMVDVSVVFGMKVVGVSPLLGLSKQQPWEFERNFKLQDPWAQRRFEKLCKTMEDEEDLAIGSTRCWLLGFRDYWIAKGKDWPVRPTEDMDKEILWYAKNRMTDGFQTTTYFWFENQKVKATYIVFFLNIPKTVSSADAMVVMKAWDDFFDTFNSLEESAIKGAWHASKLWVRAEAEKVIMESTLVTLSISLGCVFLGIVLFTTSVHLAFLVMIIVTSIIICLLFFMTVMMEWPIGAIEVLSLIVFVGFAVDYCLHIAHKYHSCIINSVTECPPDEDDDSSHISSGSPHSDRFASRFTTATGASGSSGSSRRKSSHRRSTVTVNIDDQPSGAPIDKSAMRRMSRPDERFFRTRYALERMGGAVIGSAVTTAGCSSFLLPCKLAIFTKIGYVVVAVTMYAIIYTLLPLPAVLMLAGPCGNDMKAISDYIYNKVHNIHPDPEQVKRPPMVHDGPRRYVMHMPTRAMGAVGPGIPATRTRVTASG